MQYGASKLFIAGKDDGAKLRRQIILLANDHMRRFNELNESTVVLISDLG